MKSQIKNTPPPPLPLIPHDSFYRFRTQLGTKDRLAAVRCGLTHKAIQQNGSVEPNYPAQFLFCTRSSSTRQVARRAPSAIDYEQIPGLQAGASGSPSQGTPQQQAIAGASTR